MCSRSHDASRPPSGARGLCPPLVCQPLLCAVVLCLVATAGCRREVREFPQRASNETDASVRVSDLRPGGSDPPQSRSVLPVGTDAKTGTTLSATTPNAYEANAYALSEGKRLFSSYNCVGCHAHGGGGMGPALMDDQWMYGYEPAQIFRTILEGRPNGMPAWRGKIPDEQIWQLTAYVRSLSGQAPKDAAPGRDDHMNTRPPENATPRRTPKNASIPPASVQ